MILMLGGPVISANAHAGAGDLVNRNTGLCQGLSSHFFQNTRQPGITDRFPAPCPAFAKTLRLTIFISDQRVSFGSANVHAKKKTPHATFLSNDKKILTI